MDMGPPCPCVATMSYPEMFRGWGGDLSNDSSLFPLCPQLEINDVTRAWGLEVDRVELAVEAVLQPPQDSLAVPSLDSTLQQLALHLLGGRMNSAVGCVPSPGSGKERGMLFSSNPFGLADTVYPLSRAEQSKGLGKSPSVHVCKGPR